MGQRIGKFPSVLRLIRAIQPELAVAFAGPPCFLDPRVRHFNSSRTQNYFCCADNVRGFGLVEPVRTDAGI